ncbi:MAG TPA: cell division protein FtsH [Planctomycetes bacterium]|nr:cell division protein FtsH [Fuerstiella sp.]HIK92772.1 cell division protein FtsH [Planctomycetota bacterium]
MKNDDQRPELSASEPSESNSTKLTATAYHEAGHAVMALILGRSIEKVTISPAQLQTGGFRLGACRIQKGRFKASKDALEDDVLILLAGMVAESHVTGRFCEAGAAQDLRAVKRLLANRAQSGRNVDRLTRRLLDKTEHILGAAAHATAIRMVSQELLQKETITGRAVQQMLKQALQ